MSVAVLKPTDRLDILRAHTAAHDGKFVPAEFVAAAADSEHPAHGWFEWDDTKAAHEHRLWQARQFVKIRYVEPDAGDDVEPLRLSAPLMVSPMDNRAAGGGFVFTDSDEGRAELRRQALRDSNGAVAFLARFREVLTDDEVLLVEQLIASLKDD